MPKENFPGADEKTPSLAHYFSWINNTNEGATEQQTLINLDFFAFLRREYGMQLDIYAFDAGAIDGPGNYYGKFETAKFKRQFPNGWKPIVEKARAIGCRIGLWGGPDGFGDTEESAQERINLLAGLCRDYQLALLKFDGVCGKLRPEKQDYFVKMMQECRKYSPDLILLNHRLNFGKGNPHATTTLMEGMETYVDVSMCNQITGTHNRVENISRKIPPKLSRLQEDHGVCLSSCLDFWDDDLILQAFNRGLILAPELYGNPWFLRDEEYPKLARIFNLFRRNRELLIYAKTLNDKKYGPMAVARGDGSTRFLTLRNLTWSPIKYSIQLNEEIGLLPTNKNFIVRQFHPSERILGPFPFNATLEVEVHAFRSCLISVSLEGNEGVNDEIGVNGTLYDVLRDLPERPVELALKGMPGTSTKIKLHSPKRTFTKCSLDAQEISFQILQNGVLEIQFPGSPLTNPSHRKIADLDPCPLPDDAEALYEVTCFSATNNCLEVRSIERSGPTQIPEVQAARDAFFDQPIFKVRGVWDKYAFDGDDSTRWFCPAGKDAALRINFGEPIPLETLIIKGSEDDFYDREEFTIEVSLNLKEWETVKGKVQPCHGGSPQTPGDNVCFEPPEDPNVPFDPQQEPRFFGESRVPFPVGEQKYVEFSLNRTPIQYVRCLQNPLYVFEIHGKVGGKWWPDRSKWRGSYLFVHPAEKAVKKVWKAAFILPEIASGAYLCVALNGTHGIEGAFASMKVDGQLYGAPIRAPSYLGHPWEHRITPTDKNYTYFFPLRQEMVWKQIEVYALSLEGSPAGFRPEVWITAHQTPFKTKMLRLT